MTENATVLFGLPGVRVVGVDRRSAGTRVLELATDEDTAAACPSCGIFSTSVKERVTTRPRDIPYGEHRILLRWNKTRWRCREDYCERGSFTESIEQVPRRARTTGRLRTQMGAAIGADARSVVEVAASHGVSWPRHRLYRFLAWCIDSNVPELISLAKTVDAWWPEINAFVLTGITNARTGMPSRTCSRRISAQSSPVITHPSSGGLLFQERHWPGLALTVVPAVSISRFLLPASGRRR